jgi:methanethiol S-methyltransferase
MKFLAFLYGLAAYVLFLAVFLYAIAFVGGFPVPVSVDTPTSLGTPLACVVDLALLGLFGIQHSGMARRGFKRLWTKLVPWPVERSTYVLFSSLVLALLFWQWQGLPRVVWDVRQPAARVALWAVFGAGWFTVLISTFMISHADLFGLRQVWDLVRGRLSTPLPFQTRFLYRVIRHPLLLGFLIAFWATPRMTTGHLLFAGVSTAYILVAVRLEERDLIHVFGQRYADYRRRVPMLIPLGFRRKIGAGQADPDTGG